MRNLMNWIKELGPLGKITLALVIYSLIILGLTVLAGIHLDAELKGDLRFDGYLSKFNWSLFALWWLFLAMLVHLTWVPFLAAWHDLQQKEMLRDRDGKPATAEQIRRLCGQMSRYRLILLGVAVAASIAVNYVDTQYLRDIYQSCNIKAKDPDFTQTDTSAKRALFEKTCANQKIGLIENLEIDFNVAYLVHDLEIETNVISEIYKPTNSLFNYAIYFQQFVAVVMAILALLQLALICNLFWRLERAAWLNKEGLQMSLDPFSKLHEYGLERWNHAWNNVYWVFTLVLLVPIASKQAQTVETPDLTQIVLQYGVPVLVAAPMVATIIARQQRLPDLWPRIREEKNPDLVALYHKQLLWPFDHNWALKLGIVVSFLLLSYLLGSNLGQLVKL
jgi:hypothetical protein